jgi:hypothetical protein
MRKVSLPAERFSGVARVDFGAVSLAVERYTDTVEVTGSNPVPRTICPFLTGRDWASFLLSILLILREFKASRTDRFCASGGQVLTCPEQIL